ncbi:hypothetical protein DPMN_058336 [Dreissena polymorpha]|uniref:Uncharacterized protein n=1 Tax=Dreissena polymorpha TaxID=45954 RepID=A0A9D4HEY2_DREPO|nr:hypothetical protein DPMN_057910 [Dreissena polymorpha]KAH3715624.1 hypothetical protein DPMN_058336 [Dreissena polymorpha]
MFTLQRLYHCGLLPVLSCHSVTDCISPRHCEVVTRNQSSKPAWKHFLPAELRHFLPLTPSEPVGTYSEQLFKVL